MSEIKNIALISLNFDSRILIVRLSFALMIDLADIRFLSAIATAPSLAAAARSLDVTPPAVSQRLTQLEERLHLRLVERGRGPIKLTAEGELLLERAKVILGDLETLVDELAARAGRIAGPLHVIAPLGFGRLRVAPVLGQFAQEHPDLRPMLTLSEDPRGAMRAAAWDVLIHVGRLPDLDIVQRKLASNRRLLVAAPAYAERFGLPRTPNEIAGHRVGVVREDQADVTLWPLTGPDGTVMSLRVHPEFASNDGEVIRAWAMAGLGIVERSEWSVAEDVSAGRLIRVLPDWALPDADVVALLNPRAVRAARVEAFTSRLADALA